MLQLIIVNDGSINEQKGEVALGLLIVGSEKSEFCSHRQVRHEWWYLKLDIGRVNPLFDLNESIFNSIVLIVNKCISQLQIFII